MEPRSTALQADSLPAQTPGKPKNIGVGSLPLIQWIFLTQKSNQGLLHCRWILYQLSYQGSPRVCSNSCPLNQWCFLTISSSAAPFSLAFSLSQHQVLFQWVSSSDQVDKVPSLTIPKLVSYPGLVLMLVLSLQTFLIPLRMPCNFWLNTKHNVLGKNNWGK